MSSNQSDRRRFLKNSSAMMLAGAGCLAERTAAKEPEKQVRVAVVGTGNHYIFDGLAGLVVCGVALGLTLALHRGGYPRIRYWLGKWAGMVPSRPSLPRAARPSPRGLRRGASS